jgi:transcriptional regulator with XRE-family HTH domain
MNSPPEVVAANVKKYRNKIGLSQEALADRSGLHRTYITKVEKGNTNISVSNLFRIADALEIEPSVLLVRTLDGRKQGEKEQ